MNLGPRKICLVGDFFVGKTSTAARFHSNTFSENYLATVGVSVNSRDVTVDELHTVKLIVWDLASMDDLTPLNINYLRSSAGIVYVVDSTRRSTLEKVLYLKKEIDRALSEPPCIVLINKIDLLTEREINSNDLDNLEKANIRFFETSALTGVGVVDAFTNLARQIIKASEG